MLQMYTHERDYHRGLRAEIQYRKVVLKVKGLKLTGDNLMLTNQLRVYLGGQPLVDLPADLQEAPRRQRPRRIQFAGSESEEASLSSASEQDGSEGGASGEEDEEEESDFEKDFKFSVEGEIVAVYYIQEFYIGHVCNILSPEKYPSTHFVPEQYWVV